jgi:tetratricopeptide (TPR) repeat protein
MERIPLKNPGRFFAVWAGGLAGCLVCIIVINVELAQYAERTRQRNPETYFAAAQERLAGGDIAGTHEQINKAIACDPDSPMTWHRAGDIAFAMKQWEKALGWYNHALGLGGTHPGLRTNKLWTLIELRRYSDAIEFGKQSISGGFDSPLIPRYVAEAYVRDGKLVEALPYLEDALKGSPSDLYLLEHLWTGHKHAGNEQRAREIRERISEVQRNVGAASGLSR